MKITGGILACATLLGGCASIPDVAYRYYPARANAVAKVTQSVDCTADKTDMVVLNTPDVVTQYSADYSARPFEIRFDQRQADLADNSATFSFFEDGRLKSINAESTGQGEAFLKSAISLIGALAPLGGGGARSAVPLPQCDVIAHWGGGKPVSLNYQAAIDFASDDRVTLEPTADSKALYELLKSRLPVLQAKIESRSEPWAGASYDDSAARKDKYVLVRLRKVRSARVRLTANGQSIWSGEAVVPTTGEAGDYMLPIPKAALFGKQSFALTLTGSGAIDTVTYGKLTGATAAVNVLTAGATALAPQSTAAQAADLKAQSDLIVQQQRLARCRTQPDQCQ
ncbi:MAG: hypothetical protein QOE79_278 [Sphingomonadales bacterium]|nr:hypothetical protein [Sphingomonadales bacterium]MEA3050311.1 hypothetical protein [Sphingomonadales bacterium]